MLAVPAVIGLFTTGLSTLVLIQQIRTNAKIDVVASDVLRVEKATNSHTDKLVEATDKASRAAGKADEVAAQLARQTQRDSGAKSARESDAAAIRGAADQAARDKKAAADRAGKDKADTDKAVLDNALRLKKGGTP